MVTVRVLAALLIVGSLLLTACDYGGEAYPTQLNELVQTTNDLSESIAVLLQADLVTTAEASSTKRLVTGLQSQVHDAVKALEKEKISVSLFWLNNMLEQLDLVVTAVHARTSQGGDVLTPDERTALSNGLSLLSEMGRTALDLQGEEMTASRRLSETLRAWDELASDMPSLY
ncbi:MAG: hypothetical protein A6D92_04570 [Symbiobacterium thermophilum]|uniref:Uncharacterized protein n=1 Tax=Symbiobacterium thermophilum TaxID=2734 RepID=A0A1Y2T7F5_SYMTR|nr:MAG: hypothetical protein A6D92_04570 [Symbiobacterium thermophilum]